MECEIESIEKVIDASTWKPFRARKRRLFVGRHEVAELTLRTKRRSLSTCMREIVPTGRFVIVDGFEVSGGGIIADGQLSAAHARTSLHKSDNIYWSHGKVTAEQRELRNGHLRLRRLAHRTCPAPGKSTIATELERELFNLGKQSTCWTATTFATAFVRTWRFHRRTARKTSVAWAKWRSCLPMRA